jgi:hypothetical protein
VPAQPERWHAHYNIPGIDSFSIEGTEIRECPVSYITPDSDQLVQVLGHASTTGVALFGPALVHWPPKAADALAVIECEESQYKAALQNAIRETHR